MKIVFMGTGDFAVPILEALANKYDVVLTVSQPDTIIKNKVIFTKVKEKSLELGIKCFQPVKLNIDYTELVNAKADVLVTASYGQIVSTKILDLFNKCINVHGSILPMYRGGAPIQRAIMDGMTETGVTIMQMEKGMDTGRIYSMKKIPITSEMNNTQLFSELSILGRDLLMESIKDIVSNKNVGVPQDNSLATYAKVINREEELIDFNLSTKEIVNKIRGLSHEPGAYFKHKDISFKVYSAKESLDFNTQTPGTVLNTNKKLIIKTKDSAIEIITIKQESKKEMSVKDFLNGQKLINPSDIIK